MIELKKAPPEVKALAEAMSALSVQLFGAGWHTGCELPIWQAMTVATSPWSDRADPDLVIALRRAWLVAHGWVVWDEESSRLTWLTDEEWYPARYTLEGL
jgi:hypothetical protein